MLLHDKVPTFSARALELFARSTTPKGLQVVAAAKGPAEILLYDHIGYGGVTDKTFAAALVDAGEGPLRLRINSPGGDVFGGVAIRNMIRERGNVTAVVDGLAASAAAFVLTGADRVLMHDSSLIMIHNSHTIAAGNRHDMIEIAAVMAKVDSIQGEMFSKRTGQQIAVIEAALDAETWFAAQEAIDFGLVDEIISDEAEPPVKAIQDTIIQAVINPDEIARRRRVVALLTASD